MNVGTGAWLLLVGATTGVVGIYLWRRVRKEFEWDAVEGTVRDTDVVWDGEFYLPKVEYSYAYRGRSFRGTKVRSLAVWNSGRGAAWRAAAEYRAGSAVTVYVNPKKPWNAVLERGGDPKFLPVILCVAVVFSLLGFLRLE